MRSSATVVLIHGAWFGPSFWDAVIAELKELGPVYGGSGDSSCGTTMDGFTC